ncbi:MAG: hypothetical protein WC356_00650 [Candidatus Micrarchaeia archaeon]|jgi:hypothetical protein
MNKIFIIGILIFSLLLFGCVNYDNKYIPCCTAPINISISNMSNCSLSNGTIVEALCDIELDDEGNVIGGNCTYEESYMDSRDPLRITFPICTHAQFNPCINDQCVAMVCGKGSYLPSLSASVCEITENHTSVMIQQLNKTEQNLMRELYKTFCDFKVLNTKTTNEIKKSNGEQWLNAFRFGIGTTFSEFEESRYYFPVYDKLTYLNPIGDKDRFMNYLVPSFEETYLRSTCTYSDVPFYSFTEPKWWCSDQDGNILHFSGTYAEAQHECEQTCAEEWGYSLFTKCTYLDAGVNSAWMCTDRLGNSTTFNESFFPDTYTARRACELFCDRAWGAATTECTTTENHPVFMDDRGSYYLDVNSILINQDSTDYVMDTVYDLNRSFYADELEKLWGYQKWSGYTDGDGIHHSGMIFECKNGIECLSGLCTNDWGYQRDVCYEDGNPSEDIMCHCRELENGIIICFTGTADVSGTETETTITGCEGEYETFTSDSARQACALGLIDEEYCNGCYMDSAYLEKDKTHEIQNSIYEPIFLMGEGFTYANLDVEDCMAGEFQCIAGICQECSEYTLEFENCGELDSTTLSCTSNLDCIGCSSDVNVWRDRKVRFCTDGSDNELLTDISSINPTLIPDPPEFGSDESNFADCCDANCWGTTPCDNFIEYYDFSDVICNITIDSPSYVRFNSNTFGGVELSGYIGEEDEYIYVDPEFIDNIYFVSRCNIEYEMETAPCFDEWYAAYEGTGTWESVEDCLTEDPLTLKWLDWYVLPSHSDNPIPSNFRVPFRYKITSWGDCAQDTETSIEHNVMPDLKRYGWCEPSTMVTMAVQEVTVSDKYTHYCPDECTDLGINKGCNCDGEPLMYEKGTIEPSVKYLYDKKIELQKLNVMPILIAKDPELYVGVSVGEKCAKKITEMVSMCLDEEYPNILLYDGWCYKDGYSPSNCTQEVGIYKYNTIGSTYSTLLEPYLKTTDPLYGGYGILDTGTEIIVIGDIGIDSDDELDKRAQAIKKECPNCLVAIHAKANQEYNGYNNLITMLDTFFGYDSEDIYGLGLNKVRLNNIDLITTDFNVGEFDDSFYRDESGYFKPFDEITNGIIDAQIDFQRQFLQRYEKPSLILNLSLFTRSAIIGDINLIQLKTGYDFAKGGGIKGLSIDASDGERYKTNYNCDTSTQLTCNSTETGLGCINFGWYASTPDCGDGGCGWYTDYSAWMPWNIGGDWTCGVDGNTKIPYVGSATSCSPRCHVYKVVREVKLPSRDLLTSAKITKICRDDCSALEVNGEEVHQDTGICTGAKGCTPVDIDILDLVESCDEDECNNTFSIYVMDWMHSQVGAKYEIEYTKVEYSDSIFNENFTDSFYEYLFTNQADLVQAGIIGVVYSEWHDEGDGTGLILGEDGKTEHFCALQENSKELIGMDTYVGYSKVYAWEDSYCACLECTASEIELGLCGDGTNSHICEDGKPCGDGSLTDADNVQCMPMCARTPIGSYTDEEGIFHRPPASDEFTCEMCNESIKEYDCKIYYSDGTIEQGPAGQIKNLTIWDADILGALPKESKCCMIDQLSGNLFTYTKTNWAQLNNELIIYPKNGDEGQDCGKIEPVEDINMCPGSPSMPRRRGELVCSVN